MPLNKVVLKQEIKALHNDMMTREEDSTDEYATRLSDMIDDYVKGMTITYIAGLAAPSGPVTGTIQIQIS